MYNYLYPDDTADKTFDEALGFSSIIISFGCLTNVESDEASESHFHLTLAILHTTHLNMQMKHKYFVHTNPTNSKYELTNSPFGYSMSKY